MNIIILSMYFVFVSMDRGVAAADLCHDIACSNVFDPVCAVTKTRDDTRVIRKYQNACHLHKAKCPLKEYAAIQQIPGLVCGIRQKTHSGRRVNDFGIVGAHQACNHLCPTYCVDTYEPACAQIWQPGMKKYVYRPMINHCHIDLLSCALAVNVTIHALGRCYKNPAALMFLTQVAALKSMKFLEDQRPTNDRDAQPHGKLVRPLTVDTGQRLKWKPTNIEINCPVSPDLQPVVFMTKSDVDGMPA